MSEVHKIGTKVRRLPGQSLREQFDDRFDNNITLPFMIATTGIVVAFIEAMHVYGNFKPSMVLSVIMAAAGIVFMVCGLRKFKELKAIKRGERGELIVAQAIERELLPKGYVVLHDVQIEYGKRRFNVDHLLIGSNGVCAIETKNYSKPKRGEVKVTYDGKRVRWNGVAHQDDEARQAVAVAMAAKELIFKETGLKVFVKPVLCAVGWFACSNDLYGHPVLVLMEKQLGSLIPKVYSKVQLSDQERNLIIAKLSSL